MLIFIFRIVFFVFCIGLFSTFYNFTTIARSARESVDDASLLNKITSLSEEELDFLDTRINQIATSKQFNGQILIARYGNILFNRTFGFSDFRNATPVTHNTQFQLASITKTFTATAVLMLHQQGMLHIDSLVVAYIPEFPYTNITVRNLLNHTSGVQNYMWIMERYWNQTRLAGNEDMLRTFIRLRRPLDFSPGTRFAYSNTGYAFLAILVERVSGQRFPQFMEQHIFVPLQMHNTLVWDPSHGLKPSNMALGFRSTRSGKAIISQSMHDGIMGDKGIFSTAADLYKWDRAIATNQLLSSQLWNSAFDRAQLANQNTIEYGLGWRIQSFLDQRIVHHPGRWSGFRTSFKRFIDSDATLIILANNNMNISTMVHELQQVIFHREIANNPGIPMPAETEQEAAGSNME